MHVQRDWYRNCRKNAKGKCCMCSGLPLAFSPQWLVKWCFIITGTRCFRRQEITLVCAAYFFGGLSTYTQDITYYQTQRLTFIVCLWLIFLEPTFKNWSCSSGRAGRHSLDQKAPSGKAYRTTSIFLVFSSSTTPFFSSFWQPFLYVRLLSIHVSPR